MKTKMVFILAIFSLLTYCGNSSAPVRTDEDLKISEVRVGGIDEESANISWKTNLAASSQVQYGNSSSLGKIADAGAAMVKDHLVALSGLTPNTTYYYKVISKDGTENSVESEVKSFKTDTVKTSGPIISSIQVKSITSSSALIYWETDVSADSRVNYGITSNLGDYEENTDQFVNKHYVALSGLNHNQVYHFNVRSESKWGYASESQIQTFETRDLGKLKFSPGLVQSANVGDVVEIDIQLEDIEDVFSLVFEININTNILRFTGMKEGELLKNSSKYEKILCQREPVNRDDVIGYVSTWKIEFDGDQPLGTKVDLNNDFANVMTLKFEVVGTGETRLQFDKYEIKNAQLEEIQIYEPNNVFITVK